jgi:hypothetical protein
MNDHILDAESLPRYSEKVSSENDSFSMKSGKGIFRKCFNTPKETRQKQRDCWKSGLLPYTAN